MPSADRYSWPVIPLGERYGYLRAAGRVSLAPPPTVETVTVVQTVTITTEKRFANVAPQVGRQFDVPLRYRGVFGLNGRGRRR